MKWNVRKVFTREETHMPIEDKIDLSEMVFQNTFPIQKPVVVTGSVSGAGSVVILRMKMEYCFNGQCDRCLELVEQTATVEAEHILVTSVEDEDNDDLVVVDQFMLDLDELVCDDVWIELPSKCLCKPDCQGLCPRCGKNLNQGPCGCSGKETDPRLAALTALLK